MHLDASYFNIADAFSSMSDNEIVLCYHSHISRPFLYFFIFFICHFVSPLHAMCLYNLRDTCHMNGINRCLQ